MNNKIKLREQYEKETGDKFPSGSQIGISEWYNDYYKWVEEKALLYFSLTHKKFEGNHYIKNEDVDSLRRMMFGRD